ncbi:L-asparaginase-like [Latimeria chalumnae]|uniref:L-asparaginase-like n=1 Tax=Latimeria chalumnae TaxID=7897 RepID=UPI0006D93EA9|nr:PREDICTED: L-asparaginase-like [Latimeria chalumnae]|eukprot:XP_014346634.1 PREDICTED: L-asparaginase-like [Latimeria chalumnae]
MGCMMSRRITQKDYRFWGAVASAVRLGWLGINDKEKEIKVTRYSLFPLLMCTAAVGGDIVALEGHMKVGADVTIADYGGRTPLHLAAGEGDIDTVKFLVKKGADYNAIDRFSNPPLMDAIHSRNIEVCEYLKNEGAVLMKDSVVLASELCCVAFMNDIRQMEAWHAAGVDLNSADYDSRTPLHVAVCSNQVEMVKFLLNTGVDTKLRDKFGKRPVDDAVRLGYKHIEELLLATSQKERTKSSKPESIIEKNLKP